jgi:hypothetical protein
MKELDTKIQPEPNKRISSCRDLICEFKENKFTKGILEEWQLIIDENPMTSPGEVLDPGNLIFGDKKVALKEN